LLWSAVALPFTPRLKLRDFVMGLQQGFAGGGMGFDDQFAP
jgi:hypothetical protein